MTGDDIYKRVLALLGYLNSGNIIVGENNLLKRAVDIINQICLDLKIPPICILSDQIKASDEKLDALAYGCAMLFALIEGDGAKNQLFAKIYNGKRGRALSSKEVVQDKLPITSYGVD